MMRSVERWIEAPLHDFVRDARVRLALVLETNGRVLAEYGFTRSLDVMSACALASAIHASASALGKEIEGTPFGALHHGDTSQQIFLAPVRLSGGDLLVLAVFDEASSLGIVRLFHDRLAKHLATAAPAPSNEGDSLALDFERELNRNLAALFGRA
jgi:hypothetical protein